MGPNYNTCTNKIIKIKWNGSDTFIDYNMLFIFLNKVY